MVVKIFPVAHLAGVSAGRLHQDRVHDQGIQAALRPLGIDLLNKLLLFRGKRVRIRDRLGNVPGKTRFRRGMNRNGGHDLRGLNGSGGQGIGNYGRCSDRGKRHEVGGGPEEAGEQYRLEHPCGNLSKNLSRNCRKHGDNFIFGS